MVKLELITPMYISKVTCGHYVYTTYRTLNKCYNCADKIKTIDYVCFETYVDKNKTSKYIYANYEHMELWEFYSN